MESVVLRAPGGVRRCATERRPSGRPLLEQLPDGRREGGLDALVDLGCAGDFHTAAGDLVTQLPQEAGWYWQWTEQIDREDATFGGVTCTTS